MLAGIRALVPGGGSAAGPTAEGDASSSVEPAAGTTNGEESAASSANAPDSAAQLAEFSGNVNVEDVR